MLVLLNFLYYYLTMCAVVFNRIMIYFRKIYLQKSKTKSQSVYKKLSFYYVLRLGHTF